MSVVVVVHLGPPCLSASFGTGALPESHPEIRGYRAARREANRGTSVGLVFGTLWAPHVARLAPRSSARCSDPQLRQAIDAFYERGHSAVLTEEREKDRTALRELEDAAIRDVVRRQIDIGLDVVTDGEFRRWMFMNSFYDAVSGVRTGKTVTFRNDRGEDVELAVHEIVAPLQQVDSPAAREAAFMVRGDRRLPLQGDVPSAIHLPPPLHDGGWCLRIGGGVRRGRHPDRASARR